MALRAVRNRARKRQPVNPLSARSLKKAKVLAAKLLKCAKDQTAVNCTWSTSDRGGLRTMNVEVCCSLLMCCDTITPELEGVRLADVISLLLLITRNYVLYAESSFCLRVAVTVTRSTNNMQGLSRPGLVRSTGSRKWRSRLPRMPASLTGDIISQRQRLCMRKYGTSSNNLRRAGL